MRFASVAVALVAITLVGASAATTTTPPEQNLAIEQEAAPPPDRSTVYFCSTQEPANTGDPSYECHLATEQVDGRTWLDRVWDEPLGPINLALVFLSTVIAGIALWLTQQAKETSHQQLRAYILLDQPEWAVKPMNSNEFAIQFSVRIKNYGSTPAFKLTMASNGGVFLATEEKLPDFAAMTPVEKRQARLTMGPGGLAIVPGFSKTVDAATYEALMLGTSRAFIWAVVDYEDAFGVARKTTIYMRTEHHIRADYWPCSPCKEGNEST